MRAGQRERLISEQERKACTNTARQCRSVRCNGCGVEEVARIQQPDQEHNRSPRRCDREQSDRRKLRRSSKEDCAECCRLNQ